MPNGGAVSRKKGCTKERKQKMENRNSITYEYDGSFEGLLCCVFESFACGEAPEDVFAPGERQMTMYPCKTVETDGGQAGRVLRGIVAKMGNDALDFVRRAYLTCLPQKERHIIRFLHKGFACGPAVLRMLADNAVHPLAKAVQFLGSEAHLLTGFIRFSVHEGALIAQITPKNYVLPVLAPHFAGRYPRENFMIYDKTHRMALLHERGQMKIVGVDEFALPAPDEEEMRFRRLWKMFYDTIAVPGRENPKCRMTQMPKRYWENMTEFTTGLAAFPV